jgi:arylsulfatase A-like enzyme
MEKVHNLYEDIVHVPLAIRWDGVVPSGSTCHDFVSHYLDLGPTILDIAQLPTPDTYQGISMYPQLRGDANSNRRQCITASCHGQQFGLYSQRMIRDERYKFVWNLTDISELYDLQEDPYELTNLVVEPSYQNLVFECQQRLYEELRKLRDPIVDTIWMRNQLLGEGRKLNSRCWE